MIINELKISKNPFNLTYNVHSIVGFSFGCVFGSQLTLLLLFFLIQYCCLCSEFFFPLEEKKNHSRSDYLSYYYDDDRTMFDFGWSVKNHQSPWDTQYAMKNNNNN